MANTLVRAVSLFLFAVLTASGSHGVLQVRATPTGWTLLGCYDDLGNPRTLNEASYTDGSAMTLESCTVYCEGKGYVYAGVEFADECYCGNYFTTNTTEAATDCNMACAGNSTEVCGGSSRISIYWNGTTPSSVPINDPGPPGWTFVGCYAEGTNGGRALTTTASIPGGGANMSVGACTTACAGFTYAGAEYSQECYCGNEISNGGFNTTISDCNMVCAANSTQFCGGSSRLDLYEVNSVLSSSSSTISSTKSSSIIISSTTSSSTSTTTSSSSSTKSSSSTTSSTTTSATKSSSATTSTTTTSTTTTSTTKGSSTTTSPTTTSTTKSSTTSSSTTKSSSTKTSTSSSSSPTSTGWTYDGCWVDNPNARIVQYDQPDNNELTVESCIATCEGLNYTVAAMEWGVQCFCGDQIVNAGALATDQTECSMACGGNSSEICGASNRMSIYNTGTLITLGEPVTQTGGLGGWTYRGCRTDDVSNRTLPWFQVLLNNNTAANCLGLCAEFGYMSGAVEWGEECYCGDASDLAASDSVPALESDCSSVCTGNASELCGGSNRISYYEWTGTPLWTFQYPTGNAAGEYQYVIDAPIVPIISTPGVNGKVAFVEKYGTSTTAGSTGAYELDVSTLTWRTMHVSTDVFCSASLVLPDKGGRQLNVGGWNYDSVWGLRLYWPDGSPGVTSVNDWQEDYNEIHLQAARWYPTAMTMSNGSIIVIGGETTAAGAASPTLEILPTTGGGLVYFDWLERTDPNNLYPFIAVLPSGGIFVAYYNEARILDPVTFDTIKQLPNMPGSVNNFLSGRTYPVEGTMMLLPQHAPYTDPLVILICGGSAPQNGAGSEAIDNCISTRPDDASPTWTLERMPSRRVMSCMVALPDGTYLILNGAQQGVAGFRLGSRPNLQAVLYDPTLPIGSRMSLMATTTIARMYHSEASLLQDGRVIVSGSDPEDNNYPQEYRVEMFLPPYLLNGLTPPSFTISNKDWTYGEQITISITLPSGNAAKAKVSLIAAVSATHGNSMGQRTIFPSSSCTTTSCTITAPPNNKVCPPGWFHLFVLDGPTPSHSTWIRIGGDPAGIGNWPQLPDFSVPGI